MSWFTEIFDNTNLAKHECGLFLSNRFTFVTRLFSWTRFPWNRSCHFFVLFQRCTLTWEWPFLAFFYRRELGQVERNETKFIPILEEVILLHFAVQIFQEWNTDHNFESQLVKVFQCGFDHKVCLQWKFQMVSKHKTWVSWTLWPSFATYTDCSIYGFSWGGLHLALPQGKMTFSVQLLN